MSSLLGVGAMVQQTVLFIFFLGSVEGFKYLYVSTMPSPSHGLLADGYINALLKRGHQVTLLSPFTMKDPPANVSQIDVSFLFNLLPPALFNFTHLKAQSEHNNADDVIKLVGEMNRLTLEHEEVKTFIEDNEQNFDLVIVDWFYNEIVAGFAALYECPLVYASSLDAHSAILRLVDAAANPAYTDDTMMSLAKPYTFLQRAEMLWRLLGDIFILESLRSVEAADYSNAFSKAAAARGVTLPAYENVVYNASLVLINSHPSFSSSVALPQNVKSIGGYHIEVPTKPLPSDLQNIMDTATHGVVYFSLGTNAKAKDIPIEIRRTLINMFAGLKQTVLWKFEEDLPDLPKNLITRKWMPQSSILAHPNLKVFITHGGLLSTTESVHYGVPIIGVPLFGDQFLNTNHAVRKGFAIKVRLTDDLADKLNVALDEILSNPRYEATVQRLSLLYHDRPLPQVEELVYLMEYAVRTGGAPHLRSDACLLHWYRYAATAKRLSSLYHDRPLPPAEELVYWLEYAVRTGGAPHLRSAALLLPWYQRLYLDLLALIAATLLGLVLLLKYIFIKLCNGKRQNSKKIHHKKNN